MDGGGAGMAGVDMYEEAPGLRGGPRGVTRTQARSDGRRAYLNHGNKVNIETPVSENAS